MCIVLLHVKLQPQYIRNVEIRAKTPQCVKIPYFLPIFTFQIIDNKKTLSERKFWRQCGSKIGFELLPHLCVDLHRNIFYCKASIHKLV